MIARCTSRLVCKPSARWDRGNWGLFFSLLFLSFRLFIPSFMPSALVRISVVICRCCLFHANPNFGRVNSTNAQSMYTYVYIHDVHTQHPHVYTSTYMSVQECIFKTVIFSQCLFLTSNILQFNRTDQLCNIDDTFRRAFSLLQPFGTRRMRCVYF